MHAELCQRDAPPPWLELHGCESVALFQIEDRHVADWKRAGKPCLTSTRAGVNLKSLRIKTVREHRLPSFSPRRRVRKTPSNLECDENEVVVRSQGATGPLPRHYLAESDCMIGKPLKSLLLVEDVPGDGGLLREMFNEQARTRRT